MEDQNKVVVKLISDTVEKPDNAQLVVKPQPTAVAPPEQQPAPVQEVAVAPVVEAAQAPPAETTAATPTEATVVTPAATPAETSPEQTAASASEDKAETPPENAAAQATEQAEATPEEKPVEDQQAESSEAPKKKKRSLRIPKLNKRTTFIIVLTECLLLILALFVFSRSVSLNRDDDVAFVDTAQADEVSCSNGELRVNNVSVNVPNGNDVTYNISYAWGPDDVDYPTVPRVATASYTDKDGNQMYDFSLYRSDIIPTKQIPKGKDANNWFNDWATDDSPTNLHTPKDAGSIHGFLVSSREDIQKDDSGKTYGSTSYYFALQSSEGMSIYIVEGILYDKAHVEAFDKAMEDCINAIKIKPETI